jgi:hypothetical protein
MYIVGGASLIRFSGTKAWGVGPASGQGNLIGDVTLDVGDYVSLNFSGLLFSGVVSSVAESTSHTGGVITQFSVLDNRVRLQWQYVFGAWNMVDPNFGENNRNVPEPDSSQYASSDTSGGLDDVALDDDTDDFADSAAPGSLTGPSTGEERRKYWHILPTNWKAQIKTFSDEPLTVKDILNSGMGSAWGSFGFKRTFHAVQDTVPAIGIDALNGKSCSSFISEISSIMGLDVYLKGSRELVWDRKGSETFVVPDAPVDGGVGGCLEDSGRALATWPTRVRVVGDPALVQVPNIVLEKDWAEGWEDYLSELKWIRRVGEIYELTSDAVAVVAKRNALARQITVQEYITKAGEAPVDFADRRSWGQLSRMDIPAWIYLNEIVFRSYRIPEDFEFEGVPLSSLNIHEGLLCGVEAPVDGDDVAYRSAPVEFYPSAKAFVMAKGQPLDLVDLRSYDQFIDDRESGDLEQWQGVNDFEIDAWHSSIRFSGPMFLDGDESAGESLYVRPNKGQGGYPDRSTSVSDTDYESLRVLNPNFKMKVPEVTACFVFEVGKWSAAYGSGPRRLSHYARNLSQHILVDADNISDGVKVLDEGPLSDGVAAMKEVLFQNGLTCGEFSEKISESLIARDSAIESGTYRSYGIGGFELSPAVDRVTTTIDQAGGIVEVVELVLERGTEGFVSEVDQELRSRTKELFPGQAALREEVKKIKTLGTLLARKKNHPTARNAVQSFADAGYKAVGDQNVSPQRIEDSGGVGPADGGGDWKAGDIVWLDKNGKPDASGSRFGGVVMDSSGGSAGSTFNTAVRGVVPTKVMGPFSGGDVVGCDQGDDFAKVGGSRPVGRVNHASGYDDEELIIASVHLTRSRERCVQFEPIVVGDGADAGIGICPGWVVYHEPQSGNSTDGGTIGRKVMPKLNDTPLDEKPAPKVSLGEGDHGVWLVVHRNLAEVVFDEPGEPSANERFVKVAEFSVVLNGEGHIAGVRDLKQFIEGPFVDWAQGSTNYQVIAWTEEGVDLSSSVHKAVMIGGDFFCAGGAREGEASLMGQNSYEAKAFEVLPGQKLVAEWDTSPEGVLHYTVDVKLKDKLGDMVTHEIPCNCDPPIDGHYEKTVAEFSSEDGVISVRQKFTGCIQIWPDRVCPTCPSPGSEPGGSPGSEPGGSPGSEPVGSGEPEPEPDDRPCVKILCVSASGGDIQEFPMDKIDGGYSASFGGAIYGLSFVGGSWHLQSTQIQAGAAVQDSDDDINSSDEGAPDGADFRLGNFLYRIVEVPCGSEGSETGSGADPGSGGSGGSVGPPYDPCYDLYCWGPFGFELIPLGPASEVPGSAGDFPQWESANPESLDNYVVVWSEETLGWVLQYWNTPDEGEPSLGDSYPNDGATGHLSDAEFYDHERDRIYQMVAVPCGSAGSEPGSDPGSKPGSDPGSEPGSDPGSEPGSDPGSEPGSDPGSEPGSDPGSEPGSDPGSEPGSDPGSGKTAVIPMRWATWGYCAMWAVEGPDCRFEEVVEACLDGRVSRFKIHPWFIEACEPGTLMVIGCVPQDVPVKIAACVEDGVVVVRQSYFMKGASVAGLKITGIRKGYLDERWAERSHNDFVLNEIGLGRAWIRKYLKG